VISTVRTGRWENVLATRLFTPRFYQKR
jgi:hypothetical protein